MATTLPAMKARLGNTDYYILSMKAEELTKRVTIPKKMDGWKDMSIDELYQRDINYSRVKKQIAPYFSEDESRFCGAIIVAAMNFDEASFEPLSDIATKGLPGLYKTAAANIGFLNLSGGEKLVPLDGQHRLKAIEFAISGRDEQDKDIPGITPCTDLANEDVSVILVPYEPKKARKIFTRVNRYAKQTTTGENYITEDDDIIAVLAREVANKQIGGRLVKYGSNTLSAKDAEFTTLSIIYNCNAEIICKTFPEGKVDKTALPDKSKQKLYQDKVREVWGVLIKEIEVFADALSDHEESGDQKRRDIRKANLLGKPVTQECLVHAFICLTDQNTNMTYEEACRKLNSLPWSINEKDLRVWDRILWSGGTDGKIITKKRRLTTDIITYLAGKQFTPDAKNALQDEYLKQFPESERKGKTLPELP